MKKTLTDKQKNFISMLLEGERKTKICKNLGITIEELEDWYSDPFFIAYVNREKSKRWGDMEERLQVLLIKALDNLREALNSENESVRVKTSLAYLRYYENLNKLNLNFYLPKTEREVITEALKGINWDISYKGNVLVLENIALPTLREWYKKLKTEGSDSVKRLMEVYLMSIVEVNSK